MLRVLFVSLIAMMASAQVLDTERVLEQQKVEAIEAAFQHGDYQRCADACNYVLLQGAKSPEFHTLLIRSLDTLGQTADALKACDDALKKHADHLPLLTLHHQVLAAHGKKDEAASALKAINQAARKLAPKDRTVDDMVSLGLAASAAGADPAKVIEQYLSPAKRKDAKSEKPYLAIGRIALEHADYAKAAKEFQAGLKAHGEHPELRLGLALAFAPSDRAKSMEHLERVLEANSNHIGALVLKAEHLISAEKFDEADAVLLSALRVNQQHAETWALRAVIAMIGSNDPAKATEARTNALADWSTNPKVDFLIGKSLSRAYRFAEAAQQQREVLALDPNYLPAKLQLAQDLMKLGQTDEAWKLAAEIREADSYNTQAHNLGLLEQEMNKYRVETQNDFILRMTERDWQVYGPRALTLLREARSILGPKYGHSFDKPTMVEFFPSQQDFAIRTFGALGGQGLLGVCFGTVITMNSPGSLTHGRSNWESTLWHEFCHVVTLSVTRNRMPRWLSEGISVYEEAQRDPSWGMKMTSQWRKAILEDEMLTPLGEMSSAFMKAQSSEQMLFAYYESSMAVSWMISTHGWEKFRGVLRDLATGTRINEALSKNLAPMEQLEPAFADYMKAQANAYAPTADWSKPEGKLADFLAEHPTNLRALRQQADDLLESKQWESALVIANKLITVEPDNATTDSGYWIKGKALHQLGRLDEEIAVLRTLSTKSSDALPVFLRLIEIDQQKTDWPSLMTDAGRAFALNPFLPQPTEALAAATEATGRGSDAALHYDRLLNLNPTNPAKVRFKLATLLKPTEPIKAKRHVLEALALAPRYRDAQKLLLDLQTAK